MVNPSKIKGTAWESEVARTLVEEDWPHAERRALQGALDKGDIAGVIGVAIEAKNAKGVLLGPWLDEAHIEAINAKADMGVVWFKRRGRIKARDGFVLMDGGTFMRLLKLAGY